MARYLSPIDVWAIAFGCMVGWGSFVMPGTTFLPVAGPAGTAVALGLCTIVMLVIGRSYAYLMQERPGTGGVYAYAKEAFGRDHAFLCSWFLTLSYLTIVFLNATALFVITRTALGDAALVGFHYQVAGSSIYLGEVGLSAAVLVVTALLFVFAKPFLQRLQTALAVVLFAGIAIIVVAAAPHISLAEFLAVPSTAPAGAMGGALAILVLAPWAFVGFDVVSLETAHFRFPMDGVWKIVVVAIVTGGAAYAFMAIASIASMPAGFDTWQAYIAGLDGLSGVESVPAFYVAQNLLGAFGLPIALVTAVAAILTGIIAALRATIRLLSTMAEDRILSKEFLGTTFCVVFIMAISILASLLGRNTLEWYVEITSFGAIVGFGYASASAARIAARNGHARARATGIAGVAMTVAFAGAQLASRVGPIETMSAPSFLLLALWCLLGFAFYWRTARQTGYSESGASPVAGAVLFCLLFYSALVWLAKNLLGAMDAAGVQGMQGVVVRDVVVFMLLAAAGLALMLYIQRDLRRRQQRLEREKIRAEEGSKAKSQFLFNMSHDIRTPMNAIMGYTRLMEQEPDMPQPAREYAQMIDASGRQLLALIDDILEMSRIENGKMELAPCPTDLRLLMRQVRDLFVVQMREKGIAFSVDAANVRDALVMCDGNRLHRVLQNLVSNAYKFTPEGGTVSVVLQQMEAGQVAEAGRGSYQIRVKDDGIGMSAEFVERVFDAFERERTSTASGIQGTGLGMAITKNIVDMMGGTIQVETEPGQGTEFVLNLDFELADDGISQDGGASEAGGDSAAPSTGAPDAGSATLAGVRVLLAEDNDVNRKIMTMLLGRNGLVVDVAENGQVALRMLSESQPGFYGAVLMDVQMPVMDGLEATRRIRALGDARLAAVPIIAVTANAFEEDVQKTLEAGMNAHVSKPIDPDEVLRALESTLE